MTPPTAPVHHPDRPATETRSDGAWTDGTGQEIDWERPPPRGPLVRWRAAGAGLLLVAVAVLAWWAVVWLTSPASPSAAPGETAQATASAGPAVAAHAPAGGASAASTGPGPGSSPSAPRSGAAATPPAADGADARVRVHVVGAVEHPAVVELPADARVADAVAAAGGARRDARTDRINLAAPVTDGQQITVPDADTPVSAASDGGPSAAVNPEPTTSTASGPGVAGGAGSGRVDLNTADAAMLETLPGVGPATAEKIIAHRESVGPFTGLQDLDAVPGIGPAALERLKDSVSW